MIILIKKVNLRKTNLTRFFSGIQDPFIAYTQMASIFIQQVNKVWLYSGILEI